MDDEDNTVDDEEATAAWLSAAWDLPASDDAVGGGVVVGGGRVTGARNLEAARELAEEWKQAVLDKGSFTELDREGA